MDRMVASWSESRGCFSSELHSLMLEAADNALSIPTRGFEPKLCGGWEKGRDLGWKMAEFMTGKIDTDERARGDRWQQPR